MKKHVRVTFVVSPDMLPTIVGLIINDVEDMRIEPYDDPRPIAPLPRARGPANNKRRANGAPKADKNDPHVVARSPVGRSVLAHVRMSLNSSASSKEVSHLLEKDGIWSKNSASPTLSRLLRGGYVAKPDPAPGAPFVFIKEPPPEAKP